MCKMHNALEDDHSLCLEFKKESTIKFIHLESEVQDVKRELEFERKEQIAKAARYSELERQCRELIQQKNELDSNNIRLI